MTIKANSRIAIIGGGPGGLTLTRILQKNGLKPVLYEREQSASQRQQGGTLDLHPESGQYALQEAGLMEQFVSIARYEGQDFRLLDGTGKVLIEIVSDADDNHRPEIDRGTLRELLLNAIEPDSIVWGHTLSRIVTLDNGQHELYFDNGHQDIVDLVVAADGAFSRIRPLVSDATPTYTGVSMVELKVEHADQNHPDLVRFNGQGSLFSFADQKSILAQLNGDGHIRVYLAFRIEYDWFDTCGISFDQPELARGDLLQLFDNWSEELKNYIRYADGPMLPRRIYMLPTAHKWPTKAGITLIGDAAHLMSPFAGKGANLAMRDAAELAYAIQHHDDLNTAVEQYESKMFDYAAEAAQESDLNLKLSFSENAAQKLLEMMLSGQ